MSSSRTKLGFAGKALNGVSSSSKRGQHENIILKPRAYFDELLQTKIVKVEKLSRPLRSLQFVQHHGVRVTADDGRLFLVHKGSNFGYWESSWQTVAVLWEETGNEWEWTGQSRVVQDHILSDFVKAGGKNYNLFDDNCWDAANRMMDLGLSPP